MAKEWILNSAINRWGLQKKRMVGAVSDEIRKCSPKTVEEWEIYYYQNVYPKEHLIEIGKQMAEMEEMGVMYILLVIAMCMI